MIFNRENLSDQFLVELYKELLLPRIIEEKKLRLIRQGKITKWFSGMGQEAISVGSAMAMENDEYILPMHRNLGVFTVRKILLHRLFSQFQGKKNGFSKGRERSFHFGSKEHHIVGMISHLGPQISVADGIALWHKINEEKKCVLVFSGEGGTSEGDFHEGVNIAAVWSLPVIFLIENNGYGLSTPVSEQFKCNNLADKAPGYGIESRIIDGNNVLEVYNEIKKTAVSIRENPRPVLIEAKTFRMRGHEEASGTKYIPNELFELWSKLDPIDNFEQYLILENIITKDYIAKIRVNLKILVDKEWEITSGEPQITCNIDDELNDIYSPYKYTGISADLKIKTDKRFFNAITDALRQSLHKYPSLILMGQDIAEYGGVFKITEGFIDEFGKDRIRNTPICESGVIGTGLGYSIKGGKSVIEMQFADFISSGFTQVVNNLAKIYYRWEQNADVVIRMPTGAGVGAGPFHSQSNEAWFTHIPGLKIVYPSNPYDAKGLLNEAINDPNPVIYFEHKALYRSVHEEIPDEYYTVEIGKAKVLTEGKDISIITYGMGVHWILNAVKEFSNISFYILDLRTLLPWDEQAVEKAVKATGKVLILHEDTLTGGFGGEISAWISENLFQYLDAPIIRCAALDTPVPFASTLEENFLPKGRLISKLKYLIKY